MSIIEFTGSKLEDRIRERIYRCFETENCTCGYCEYRKELTELVIDYICNDILVKESNSNLKMCIHDVKRVLYETILEIKKMEDENGKKDDSN